MRLLLRRALQAAGVAGLVVALGSAPVSAGVGTRLVNGDGDTAGECMGINNAGRGTYVEMQPCSTAAHQGWEVVGNDPSGAGYKIVSQDRDAAGRCLTFHGQGLRVTMDRCATSISSNLFWQQRWGWETDGNWRQFFSEAPYSGPSQCLDVTNSGLSNAVQAWACGDFNSAGHQKWKFA